MSVQSASVPATISPGTVPKTNATASNARASRRLTGTPSSTVTRRRYTALLACVLAIGSCGGGSKPAVTPVPTATAVRATGPEPLDRCPSAGAGWQALRTSGQYRPASAAHLGSGPVGVVFANDSNNDACDWSREA